MILLDLHKTYDALDRSRCFDILEGYSFGLQACQLLHMYWRLLKMLSRAVGYCGRRLRELVE